MELEQLLAQMESLGYAREEALFLCGLVPGKRWSPENVDQAVEVLKHQIEFAKKCLQTVQKVST